MKILNEKKDNELKTFLDEMGFLKNYKDIEEIIDKCVSLKCDYSGYINEKIEFPYLLFEFNRHIYRSNVEITIGNYTKKFN